MSVHDHTKLLLGWSKYIFVCVGALALATLLADRIESMDGDLVTVGGAASFFGDDSDSEPSERFAEQLAAFRDDDDVDEAVELL